MNERRFSGRNALLISFLIVATGLALLVGIQWRDRAASAAADQQEHAIQQEESTTNLAIDTNVVLEAVLDSASKVVTQLKLPIRVPLVPSGVRRFAVSNVLPTPQSSLHGELEYEGGYEFGFQDGLICGLKSPDAYKEGFRIWPKDHTVGVYSFDACLATAKLTLRRVGGDGASLLTNEMRWEASVPLDPEAPHPSRWRFTWDYGNAAVVEVDADELTVKSYVLSPVHGSREPWPLSFGRKPIEVTSLSGSTAPDWTRLQIKDVDPNRAVDLVQGMLSDAAEFCRKLGAPFPEFVREGDVVPEHSEVFRGGWTRQPAAWLRLRSGVTVKYWSGSVSGAITGDSVENRPERDGLTRTSAEYRSVARLSPEEAVAKVLAAARRLNLPRRTLWLDTPPIVQLTFLPGATNGLKRYLVHWEMPETTEERRQRWERILGPHAGMNPAPLVSVRGEVDAVSGELKAFHQFQQSLPIFSPDPE